MGFAAAMPWIIQGGSALAGWLASRHAQSEAEKRNAEEQAALSGAQGAAGAQSGFGQQLMRQGLPYQTQAGNYFQTLLRGNRAAMAEATAGPRNAINEAYSGAGRQLEHSGVRGASRDQASEQLNRQRAGEVASLISGVQPGAANAVAGIGQQMTSQGNTALANSGNLYRNLLGEAAQNRQWAAGEGERTGALIGNMIYDVGSGVWKSTKWGKGGGAGGTSPNLPWTPAGTPVVPSVDIGQNPWGRHAAGSGWGDYTDY